MGALRVPSDAWRLAVRDAENAFTRVETPRWTWKCLAMPPFPTAAIWAALPAEFRNTLPRGDLVAPQYTRLPMGSSHAVLILMAIGLRVAADALYANGRLAKRVVAAPTDNCVARWAHSVAEARRAASRVLVVAALLSGGATADGVEKAVAQARDAGVPVVVAAADVCGPGPCTLR